MRKYIFAVCLSSTIGAAGSALGQEYSMAVAHVMSDQSPYQVTLHEFERLVEERSSGQIAVDIQCCALAGSETRAVQSVRTGVLTGTFVGSAALESIVEEYAVLSLPYIFEDQQQAYETLDGDVGAELLALLDNYGMHGLGFGPTNERSVGSRGSLTVETVDDFGGLKIRVQPSHSYVEAYSALGAQPTPIAFGELFMALQNRVVDALEGSPDSIYSDRLYEVIDNFSLTKTHQSVTILAVTKSWWDQLPSKMQELVQTAADEAIEFGRVEHARLNEEGLDHIRAAGVNIIEPDLEPFMEKARSSWGVILPDQGKAKELLPRILEAMN